MERSQMNAFEQSSGKPGAPSCSDGQQAADPTAQVRALLAVLNQVATTINTVKLTLVHAADNGDTLLVWPCLDSLAVAGALADKAMESCGAAPVNGASILDWSCGDADRAVMRAAGWEVQQ